MTDKEKQEMNERVARKLGWENHVVPEMGDTPLVWQSPEGHLYESVPNYSEDIVAAFEIVKQFDGMELRMNCSHQWQCTLQVANKKMNGFSEYYEEGDTAPEAIVKAFLKLNETGSGSPTPA